MIRKLKSLGARTAFFLVIVAGLGLGVIAVAMGAVIGGLLLLGARLSQPRDIQAKTDESDTADQAGPGPAATPA